MYGIDPRETPYEKEAAIKSMKDLFALGDRIYDIELQKRDFLVVAEKQ